MQIKEMLQDYVFICVMIKVTKKVSNQTLKHLFLQLSVTIWHLSIRERVRKKKGQEDLKKERN